MRRLAIRLVVLSIVFGGSWICNQVSNLSTPAQSAPSFVAPVVDSAAQYKPPTSAPANTPRPLPTATSIPAITYRGTECIEWTEVRSSQIDTRICVYGIIYTYGPYSNRWDTIQFSPSANSFRVTDFNYYYLEPLDGGDCAIIYGRIRDYGPYLIITPEKDADDAIRTGPGSLCG